MSARYEVRLLGKELCGTDVITCRFSRPEGYGFRPGQWFTLTLETAQGAQTKAFSHCSAPDDPDLDMTTRLSGSAFKNALAELSPGDHVTIAGPGGRLSLPDGLQRVCFLVGGVGITPLRSMLRDAQKRDRRFEDALLLYGNRDESCVPFGEEFAAMSGIGVRMVLCFENASEVWEGERGFISAETVRRHLDPNSGYLFVVTGPPVMVTAMERVLDALAVPDERRLIERFGPPAR